MQQKLNNNNSSSSNSRSNNNNNGNDDDDDNNNNNNNNNNNSSHDAADKDSLTEINGNDTVILEKLRRLKNIGVTELVSYARIRMGQPYPFRPSVAGKLFENTEDSNFVSEKSFSEKNVSILMGWTSFENAFFFGQSNVPWQWTDEGDH